MGDLNKYNASYINALWEEGTREEIFNWLVKLHKENVDLREELSVAKLQRDAKRWT